MACELCEGAGGELLFDGGEWRVVAVGGEEGRAYPGFCRVVWNAHVKEMSDLAPTERDELMRAVFAVEAALIAALQPVKMNLASLGNVTPHLHWHVIPRLASDPAFPKPIWAHGLEPLASAPEAQSRLGRPDAAGMGDWKSRVRRALHAG